MSTTLERSPAPQTFLMSDADPAVQFNKSVSTHPHREDHFRPQASAWLTPSLSPCLVVRLHTHPARLAHRRQASDAIDVASEPPSASVVALSHDLKPPSARYRPAHVQASVSPLPPCWLCSDTSVWREHLQHTAGMGNGIEGTPSDRSNRSVDPGSSPA